MGEKIKNFLSTKSIGFYCTACSILLSIITGIVYAVSYHNYAHYMSWLGFWMFIIGAMGGVILSIFRLDEFAAGINAAGTFVGMCLFIRHIYMYVQSISGGLDVTGVSANFVSCVVFIALAFVVSVVSIFLPKKKEDGVKEGN